MGGVGGGWQGLILERVFLFTVVVCLKERDISISDKHSVYIYIYIFCGMNLLHQSLFNYISEAVTNFYYQEGSIRLVYSPCVINSKT